VGRLVVEVRADRLCRFAAVRALMRATDLRDGHVQIRSAGPEFLQFRAILERSGAVWTQFGRGRTPTGMGEVDSEGQDLRVPFKRPVPVLAYLEVIQGE
jgi:hypothetical protein